MIPEGLRVPISASRAHGGEWPSAYLKRPPCRHADVLGLLGWLLVIAGLVTSML